MDSSKLQLIAVSATTAVITVGGMMLFKWLRNRHKGHHHHHGGFDDINIWLGNNYGPLSVWEGLPPALNDSLNYPAKLAEICQKYKREGVVSRALDIGCNVGSVAFELTPYYDSVVGIDVSENSIRAAKQLKTDGTLPYTLGIEGDIKTDLTAIVNPNIDRSKVEFQLASGNDLPSDIGVFGLVVLSLTLHHLPDPKAFLQTVGDLVAPSGILVISETYTWHEMMDLPKDKWVSGYIADDGTKVRGPDGLRNCLSSNFVFVVEDDIPYPTRFRTRMYLLAATHVTVWMKKQSPE